MPRRVCLSVAAILVAAACASIPAPTPAPPSTGPSLGVTTPLPPPSQSQAPSLTASPGLPSPAPSVSVSPSGSSPAGSQGIVDFGATTPLFSDTFDDPASGWGTGSTEGGDVEYADSALELQPVADRAWVWSRRTLTESQNVVQIEAAFTPSAAGYQGLLCGDSDDHLFGGVVTNTGRWVFIELSSEGATVLATSEEPGWAIVPGGVTRIALDCAGTVTGSLRMQLSLPDLALATGYEGVTFVNVEPPESFDRVGLYAEATSAGYVLRIDDLVAIGGTGDGL